MSYSMRCPKCDGRLSHTIPTDAENLSRKCRGKCKTRWIINVTDTEILFIDPVGGGEWFRFDRPAQITTLDPPPRTFAR